jgi:hypothetical protein
MHQGSVIEDDLESVAEPATARHFRTASCKNMLAGGHVDRRPGRSPKRTEQLERYLRTLCQIREVRFRVDRLSFQTYLHSRSI